MLLNTLQRTGQAPTTEAYAVQNVNSAKVEKPWPRTPFPPFLSLANTKLKVTPEMISENPRGRVVLQLRTHLYHCFHYEAVISPSVCLPQLYTCTQIPPQGHCFADVYAPGI